MNIPTTQFRTSISKHSALRNTRSAFTLVELLIVIIVIGILVGMLLPAINGAVKSSNELAVRVEMTQIEQAIEAFRTEFGFYPPSFEQFDRITTATSERDSGIRDFLRFLNRVAPNHQESSSKFPSSNPADPVRSVVWWNKVGRHLDQQSSLVFWLSGLCQSKQFPLTGGAPQLIEPFAGPSQLNVAGIEIERDVFFDFQPNQLVYGVTSDPTNSVDGAVTTIQRVGGTTNLTDPVEFVDGNSIPGGSAWVVAAYRQAKGPSNGDLLMRYRDAASYNIAPFAYITQVPGGARDTRGRSAGDALVQDDFANPKTFQLISFGLDGEAGVPTNPTGLGAVVHQQAFALSTDSNFMLRGYDNMTNFSAGRLELFVIENE